jgi:hypothetical protein
MQRDKSSDLQRARTGLRERLPVDLPSIGFIAGLVLGFAAIYGLSLVLYRPTTDPRAGVGAYNLVGGLLVAAIIIPLSLPVLKRESLRQRDRRLLTLLVVALFLKVVVGTLLRHYASFELYEGSADAAGYHGRGFHIMERFRAGIFDHGLESLSDTDFIRFFTGVLYTIIGPTSYGGFLVYSWMAFWGMFLFYRAFTIAVPQGRARTYGRLLFFFPSMLFWPSSIGKEAWMVFTLGIAAYGAARVLSGSVLRGLPIAGLGLWLGTLIRPHVPGMLGAALLIAFVLARPHERFHPTRPMVKIATLGILVAASFLLVTRTEGFLRASDILSFEGMTEALEKTSERSAHGGSEFDPPIVRSPVDLPLAFGTVIYRPFVFEANNQMALLSAIEGLWLLLFTIRRLPWGLSALRSMRLQPFVALAGVYTVLFVIAFSSMPNFGLLARQRVQLFPFFFVLLSIPYIKKKLSGDDPALADVAAEPEPAAVGR